MIEAISALIDQAGWLAPLYYIGAFVFAALVPVIPTPLIGALGGTAFGFLAAVLYGLIGLGLGALTALAMSRLLGRRLARWLVPRRAWEQWESFLGMESVAMWGVVFFVLNLDIAVVAAGLSRFPLRSLWLAAMVARAPWLLASAWFGDVVLVSDLVLVLVLVLLVPLVWGLRRLRPRLHGWLLRFAGPAAAPAADASVPAGGAAGADPEAASAPEEPG